MSLSRFSICLAVAGVLAWQAAGQSPQPLTPREAFYSAGPERSGVHKVGDKPAKPVIGVSYTLQKLVGQKMEDISPDAVFHAQDRISFVVQTNVAGYLYIGNKRTNGEWKTMFPSPETEGGDNRVEPFHKYLMPPGYRFVFEDPPGVEEVFILFSREKIADVENLWHAPGGDSKSPEKTARLVAASIPNSAVEQLRSTSQRDLRIEKIDDETKADGEKAVYVVNPTGRSDSRVWADLKLVHK